MLGLKNTIIVCLKPYQIKNFTKYLEVPYVLTNISNLKNSLFTFIYS